MKLSDLRPYQNRACAAVLDAWDEYDKVLLSLPCGTGKTVIAAFIVSAWLELAALRGEFTRILWLAHRDELINQGAEAILDVTGEEPGIEKGELSVISQPHQMGRAVVVSSIQTMQRPNRREKFSPSEWGLVVVDECHRVCAPGYLEVLNYFKNYKLLGMTATVSRTDQVSLGKVFDHVAYHYELSDAVNDGWLARPKQHYIQTELDFSKVRLDDHGDLSAEDLDRILLEENAIHKIVAPVVKAAGDRPTIIFTPRVRSAEAVAAVLGRPEYSTSGVRVVSGKTPDDERREITEGFRRGDFQYVSNCSIYTEGADFPRASCIVIARPTKSKLLLEQMIGRGLRGGRLCPIEGKDDGCLVIDLMGVAQPGNLVHTADLLGGKYDEVVVAEAKRRCEEKAAEDIPADVLAELEAANLQAEELRHTQRIKIVAEAKLKRKTIDPFAVFAVLDTSLKREPGWYDNPATEEQVKFLGEHGIKAEGSLTFSEAKQLREEISRRRRDGIANFKQARILVSYGYSGSMKFEQAKKVIGGIANRGFKHTRSEAINRNRWKRRK